MSERLEEDTVAPKIEDSIAWVSLNRPEKRNCMSPKPAGGEVRNG